MPSLSFIWLIWFYTGFALAPAKSAIFFGSSPRASPRTRWHKAAARCHQPKPPRTFGPHHSARALMQDMPWCGKGRECLGDRLLLSATTHLA
jgi:hypothetical protein